MMKSELVTMSADEAGGSSEMQPGSLETTRDFVAGATGSHDGLSVLEKLDWSAISCELKLSSRELEVVRAIVSGNTLQDTARLMELGLGTVKTYSQRIYRKLAVSNHRQLIMAVISTHLRLAGRATK